MNDKTDRWQNIAIAGLMIAGVTFLVFGTRHGLFACEGGSRYNVAHAIDLGGCKTP